jgi:magnesium transporter
MASSISEAQTERVNHLADVTTDDSNTDIYRGDPPPPAKSFRPSSITSSSSESSTGGRLGAIAAVLELAISRWARAHSTSSSTSSEGSSIVTTTRSRRARRRGRRPSSSNLHSGQSERDVTARLKAREESRQSPREFNLYLPPSLSLGQNPGSTSAMDDESQPPSHQQGITHTTSLPLILDQLDNAMKKATKPRRNQSRFRADHHSTLLSSHRHYMLSDNMQIHNHSAPADMGVLSRAPKGKQKELRKENDDHDMQNAWWLDVSSPNWQDMRAIGKVRPVHQLENR